MFSRSMIIFTGFSVLAPVLNINGKFAPLFILCVFAVTFENEAPIYFYSGRRS